MEQEATKAKSEKNIPRNHFHGITVSSRDAESGKEEDEVGAKAKSEKNIPRNHFHGISVSGKDLELPLALAQDCANIGWSSHLGSS